MASDLPDPLCARFEGVETSVISDALDEHGIDGVVTGLEPARPDHAAAGRARPLRFAATDGEESTNFPYAMFDAIAPGKVLVIDGVSPRISCWGGLACELGLRGGLAGVVIDGGHRDVADVREGSFPVFAAGTTPRAGLGRMRVAAVDEPIEVRGVEVAPDDVVVADSTGVVVVPADRAEAVADTVEAILEEEAVIAERIARGATADDLREDDHEF